MESCVHNVPAIENLSVCAGVAFKVMLVVHDQRGLECLYHHNVSAHGSSLVLNRLFPASCSHGHRAKSGSRVYVFTR